MKQALIKDRRYPDLFLLPSAQTKDKSAVSPEQMIKLTDELREEFDYVLLDCPAGIEQGSAMRLPELIRQSLSQLRKFLQFAMRIVS